MKDTILLVFGFGAGVLVTTAFGARVKAFLVDMRAKLASKVAGK